ncbi:MAG: hypothetical protein P8175_05605 [Deltaproteobacteria bacterium]|jgi:hypothetical protein
MATLYLIRALTGKCQKWLDDNVQYDELFAGGVPVDHRHLNDIFNAMIKVGFQPRRDFLLVDK